LGRLQQRPEAFREVNREVFYRGRRTLKGRAFAGLRVSYRLKTLPNRITGEVLGGLEKGVSTGEKKVREKFPSSRGRYV